MLGSYPVQSKSTPPFPFAALKFTSVFKSRCGTSTSYGSLTFPTLSSATTYTYFTLAMFGIIISSLTNTSVLSVFDTTGFSYCVLLVINLYFVTPEPSPSPSFISFASMTNLLLSNLEPVIVGVVLSILSIVISCELILFNSSL